MFTYQTAHELPCFTEDSRFRIIFDYHDRIREKYDPKYPNIDNFIERLAHEHRIREKKNKNSLTTRIKTIIQQYNFVRLFFFWIMTMIVSRIYGLASDEQEIPEYKMPSSSSFNEQQRQEALNDQRTINIKSKWSMAKFFFKYLCHLAFTIPGQAAYLKERT